MPRRTVLRLAQSAAMVAAALVVPACYESTVQLGGDTVEDDVIDVLPVDSGREADADTEGVDVGLDTPHDDASEDGAAEAGDALVDDVVELGDEIEEPADDAWGYDVPLVCDPPFEPSGWLAYVEAPGPAPLERRGEVRVAAHRGPTGTREYQLDLEWAGGARGTLTYRTPEGAEERLPVEPGTVWQGWLRTDGSILVLDSPIRLLAFHEADTDLAGPSDLYGWSLSSVLLPCDFVGASCGAWRGLALNVIPPDDEEHSPLYPGGSSWFRTGDGDVWLVFGSGFERADGSCPDEPVMWIEYLLRVERSG